MFVNWNVLFSRIQDSGILHSWWASPLCCQDQCYSVLLTHPSSTMLNGEAFQHEQVKETRKSQHEFGSQLIHIIQTVGNNLHLQWRHSYFLKESTSPRTLSRHHWCRTVTHILQAGLHYSSEHFDTISRRATSSHCSPARHTAMQCSNIESCLDSQEKEYRHVGLMIGTCFRIAYYHAWCFMRNGIRELGKLV